MRRSPNHRTAPARHLAGVLALALCVPALAAGDAESRKRGGARNKAGAAGASASSTAPAESHLIDANQLIGRWSVQDAGGTHMGRIEDVVLERNSRRIAYAVLAVDPGWLRPEKLFAIPWSRIDVGRNAMNVTIDIDRETLARAPGFDRGDWPDMANSRWMRANDAAFGSDTAGMFEDAPRTGSSSAESSSASGAAGTASSTRNKSYASGRERFEEEFEFRRLTELIGTDVENRNAEELGEIENILIDDREGRVAYALISRGGFVGLGEEYVPVPWHALDLRPWQDKVVVDIPRRTLDQLTMASVDTARLEGGAFAEKVHDAFDADQYWILYSYTVTVPTTGTSRAGGGYGKAWQQGSEYMKKFDPAKNVRVSGEIVSVGSFRPQSDASQGVRLRVRAGDGKVHTVYAGPQGFLAERGLYLTNGERVEVTGARAEVDGRKVVIARSISADGQEVALRDSRGAPQWAMAGGRTSGRSGTGSSPSNPDQGIDQGEEQEQNQEQNQDQQDTDEERRRDAGEGSTEPLPEEGSWRR